MRLDKYLASKFPEWSRNQIQKFVKKGFVLVNGKIVKSGYYLKESDDVKIKKFEDSEVKIAPENFKLKILYEDRDCMVIDKPAGIIVHPGSGCKSGTISNFVLNKIKGRVGSAERPGIVHRLDKNTSGVLIIAKSQFGYLNIIKQFEGKSVQKSYLVLVSGSLKHPEGIIESPIGRSFQDRKKMSVRMEGHGKYAISNYRIKKTFHYEDIVLNLIEMKIITGRTHQIRVHMSAIGNPVVGDEVYGSKKINELFRKKFDLARQFLHAHQIRFRSPFSGQELMIKSDLPKDLSGIMLKLNSFQ